MIANPLKICIGRRRLDRRLFSLHFCGPFGICACELLRPTGVYEPGEEGQKGGRRGHRAVEHEHGIPAGAKFEETANLREFPSL